MRGEHEVKKRIIFLRKRLNGVTSKPQYENFGGNVGPVVEPGKDFMDGPSLGERDLPQVSSNNNFQG